MDSVLEKGERLMEKKGISFEVCDVCNGDGLDAHKHVYRVTMHVMKLRAHFPQLSISLWNILCPLHLCIPVFCLHYHECDSSHRELFRHN